MNPFDPVLDQPHSVDVDALAANATLPLANHDLHLHATALSDLRDLEWPAGGGAYARAISVRLTSFHGDDLLPMVTRVYPGYAETIYGSEAFIVSKRLAMPLRSDDDRALFWSCECQAEADLLLRLDVEIDWGEPLEQRMVDGLLLAQVNPGRQQGIYNQANADSTRVFGNPHARPDHVELDDAGRAHLVYHVLVNGIADVSLLLTLSDVGEQMAWNAFLALRDTERTLDRSNSAWESSLRTARIWTPDPRLNRRIQQGKLATLRGLLNTAVGAMPASRRSRDLPALVDSLDALDARLSHNVLSCMRRMVERSADGGEARGGFLPELLPLRRDEPLQLPGRSLLEANGGYLHALRRHLRRHPAAEGAPAHRLAVRLCADALVLARADLLRDPSSDEAHALAAALRDAIALEERWMGDGASVDATRWQSEVSDLERRFTSTGEGAVQRTAGFSMPDLAADESPWQAADPWPTVRLAADALWRGCGVDLSDEGIRVAAGWPAGWWWALTDLPLSQGTLSLVWDGATLHSTQPLLSATGSTGAPLPVALHTRIQTRHIDETDFALTFVFVDDPPAAAGEDPPVQAATFRPHFLTGD